MEQKQKNRKRMRTILFNTIAALLLLSVTGCGSISEPSNAAAGVNESEILLAYLEENGNIINGPSVPALINADVLYSMLHASNVHVIDLRPAGEYTAGHIEHSHNVPPGSVLDHFEEHIEPNSFDLIVLVCNDAMLSTYVNGVMLILGYENVVSLRYGLSSWDEEIAESHWLEARSSHLEGRLDTGMYYKNPPGSMPGISTGERSGYAILRARAREILDTGTEEVNRSVYEVMAGPDSYYIINYWPQILYDQGHLSGAIQYSPKLSLHSDLHINTLPTERPVVTYCYTGHHSGYVTAFLRLLGYQAYNLPYGANSFIYDTMLREQGGFRSFSLEHIHNLPLSGRESG